MSRQSEKISLNKALKSRDIKKIKRELDAFPGVVSVAVSDNSMTVTVDYDGTGISAERIRKAVCGICPDANSGE